MVWLVRHRSRAWLLVLLLGLVARPAEAVLELDITEGVVEPLPIAISEFAGDTAAGQQRGREIADVISADLERSGLFRPIDRRAFIQSPDQLRGLRFATSSDNWRRVAHQVADAIYQRITGEAPYFDTQIVYVAETGPDTNRIKRLAIMDQDGANHRFLTDGGDLVLTPRFHPDPNRIAYMAYRGLVPHIYEMDVLTGREARLGDFPGMTFAPHYSPDGRQIALSTSEGGNSDIYVLDLGSGQQRRLTNHTSIDTSPSFSPDGSQIVFNSDRAGSPQLYVMNADGSDQRRISFGPGNYGSPAWSPRGDLIAFSKIQGGLFHIGVMRPDGSDERLLTRSTLDEGPAWAPNGRVIVFSREDYGTDRIRLFTIDVTGYNERELPTPLDASDPDWSNPIP